MKVSACWIMKNEEKNLRRTVESVRNAVDELVILDTGSTDGTIKLAEELGAKVYHFDWINDFSAARNRCLELVEGEAVVFIDADEWFEPALTAADRGRIVGCFTKNPRINALQINRTNLGGRGEIIDQDGMNRIIRKRPGLSFQGRVHEQYLKDGGINAEAMAVTFCEILHDGYVPTMAKGKVDRNIPLLEQTTHDKDPEAAFHAHCYLMREYAFRQEKEKLLLHLRAVLDNTVMLKQFCQKMGEGFLMLFPAIMDAGVNYQDDISVLEMDRKLLTLAEKEFEHHPYPPLARLYWRFRIEEDESRLLAEIDGVIAAIRRMPTPVYSFHVRVQSLLLMYAAMAAELRGENERAEKYASASLRAGTLFPAPLHVLLRLWRGTPLETVKERLAKIFPEMGRDQLAFLAQNTGLYGYWELTVDAIKKLEQTGPLAGEYRFAYLLLTGRSEEAMEMTKTDGGVLTAFSAWEIAKGMRDNTEGKFLLAGGMYEDILATVAASPIKSPEFVTLQAHSLVCLGRYKEALAAMLPYLPTVPVDMRWMRYLAVIGEKLDSELGQMARNIWNLNMRYRRRLREWGGLLRSGYAVDRSDKKRLRTMTKETLEQDVQKERGELMTPELLHLCEQAAAVYEAKHMPAMALECERFLYAHGREDVAPELDRLLEAIRK